MAMENMFDGVLAKITPHLTDAGMELRSGFDRICARLDLLREAVTDSEFTEIRRTINLQLTADTETELISTRPGEDWELEFVTVLGPCSVTITESGRFRFAKQYDTPDITQGIGLIVRESSTLEVVATGNDDPVKISTQFKRRNVDHPRAVRGSGQREPGVLFDHRGLDDPGRHGPVNGQLPYPSREPVGNHTQVTDLERPEPVRETLT